MVGNEIEETAKAAKAVAKLLETTLKGIGTVGNHIFEFDAKKIERISKAKTNAEKRKILSKAEAKAEAEIIKIESDNKLMERTQQRLLSQEVKRQTNVENTVLIAKNDLENSSEPVSEIPVDDDWATRFFNIAQDANNEDMQTLWAKILAGEIKKPKSFSLRTLETLRSISTEDAKLFQDAVALSIANQYIILPTNINGLEEFNLSYDKILTLRDAGLLSTGNNDNKNAEKTNSLSSKLIINLTTKSKTLFVEVPKGKSYKINVLNLTKAGMELAGLIEVDTNSKYISAIIEMFEQKGFKILDTGDEKSH